MDAYLERDILFQDAQESFGDFMLPASAGTRIFAHYRNINALTCFHWWEDGQMRTWFESPWQRHGSTPDGLLPAMAHVGYDLSDPEEAFDEPVDLGTPGKFALAEELTGVRVTPALLDAAVYTAGIVTVPLPEHPSVVIDITDANGDRFYREFP